MCISVVCVCVSKSDITKAVKLMKVAGVFLTQCLLAAGEYHPDVTEREPVQK